MLNPEGHAAIRPERPSAQVPGERTWGLARALRGDRQPRTSVLRRGSHENGRLLITVLSFREMVSKTSNFHFTHGFFLVCEMIYQRDLLV